MHKNQCDGCRQGLPVNDNGIHVKDGMGYMGCTRERYMEGPKTKRLGYVSFTIRYAVDLDDNDMVKYAKECIYEDLTNMMKYNEYADYDFIEDPTLTEADLLENPFTGTDEDYEK